MWIIDHTMQLGERKCLIVVGLRQSAWKAQDRVLGHEDVERIDLIPLLPKGWGFLENPTA
jgi:hypothetical protein